ncbi:MAG TPA: DinB family protein [Trueperaceae bacterium]|nr:DinB family protein [Trueperaceae bacterium]
MTTSQASDVTPNASLRSALKSQYHAALAMLREAVERCPDALWADPGPKNAFWQVAYHTLYFTHLYLMPEEAGFRPWEHQRPAQHPDGIPGRPDPASDLPLVPDAYSREQVLAYWQVLDGMVDACVDTLELGRGDSGFPWYRMSKLEHQLVNLRHLQHHAAQLADRVRAAADVGVRWVGWGPTA